MVVLVDGGVGWAWSVESGVRRDGGKTSTKVGSLGGRMIRVMGWIKVFVVSLAVSFVRDQVWVRIFLAEVGVVLVVVLVKVGAGVVLRLVVWGLVMVSEMVSVLVLV